MWYEYVLGGLFFGIITFIIIAVVINALRCTHEWEKVLENSVTAVYRCKKCGKEKKYTL